MRDQGMVVLSPITGRATGRLTGRSSESDAASPLRSPSLFSPEKGRRRPRNPVLSEPTVRSDTARDNASAVSLSMLRGLGYEDNAQVRATMSRASQ